MPLDDLNPKQRKKDFKTKSKQIRSKDIAIRSQALDAVFDDPRYLIEGELLLPFLETIASSKKDLEFTKSNLLRLLGFLKSSTVINGESAAAAMIDSLISLTGNLEALTPIANFLTFKLEIKIKKKETAGPNFGYSDMECALRSLSLEIMYLIVSSLPASAFSHFLRHVASIPGILSTIDQVLPIMMSRIVMDSISDSQRQESLWVLALLDAVLSHSHGEQMISPECMDFVMVLAKDETLTSVTMHILLVLSQGPMGPDYLFNQFTVGLCVSTLDSALSKLVVEPAVVPQKGKAPVKDKKVDKKAQAAAEVLPEKVIDVNDPRKVSVLVCRLSIAILSLVCSESCQVFDADTVARLTTLLARLTGAPSVWELIRDAAPQSIHVVTTDLLVAACLLTGSFGKISTLRKAVCSSGGTSALFNAMLQSTRIAGISASMPEEEAARRHASLLELRNCCEQSLLSLLTEVVADTHVSSISHWTSCTKFSSDLDLFLGQTPVFDLQCLVDTFLSDDTDLGNRSVRIFVCILESAKDREALIDKTGAFVAKASTLLLSRSQELIAGIKVSMSASSLPTEAMHLSQSAEPLVIPDPQTEAVEQEPAASDDNVVLRIVERVPLLPKRLLVPPFARSMELFRPSVYEVVAIVLMALEHYVAVSTTHVNALDISGQFSSLAQLVYLCGPSGMSPELSHRVECVVNLYHVLATDLDSTAYLRQSVFKLVRAIAASYPSSRTFSGEVPAPVGVATPDSSSACQQTIVSLSSEISDACIATLLAESNIGVYRGNMVAVPRSSTVLAREVLDSALSVWSAIAKCGVWGLTFAVQSTLQAENSSQSTDSSGGSTSGLGSVKRFVNEYVMEGGGSSTRLEFTREGAAADPKDKGSKKPAAKAVLPLFDKVFITREGALPTSAVHPSDSGELWAYMTHAIAVLGILASDRHAEDTCQLASECLAAMCRIAEFSDYMQPFFADVYSAVFLSLGGGVTLAGCIGRFGTLAHRAECRDLLLYLLDRGYVREAFWDEFASKLDPKAKGKAKVTKQKVDPLLGFALPFEPDGTHPDPSHGPTTSLWKELLGVCGSDVYSASADIGLLQTCILGDLPDFAESLMDKDIGLDAADSFGLTPLMYALLLRKYPLAERLISSGANSDAKDFAGNPAIKYAFISLDAPKVTPSSGDTGRQITWSLEFVSPVDNAESASSVLSTLVSRGADLNICDSLGNRPLHFCLGTIKGSVVLSGQAYEIADFIYEDKAATLKPHLELLCDGGANPDACNVRGVCPLHIVSALADVESMEYLLARGVLPNPLDAHRYLPLHYICATGRLAAMKGFSLLLERGAYNSIEAMVFDAATSGLSKAEKDLLDLETFVSRSFAEAVCPSAVFKERMDPLSLLSQRTGCDLTLLHLALAGCFLPDEPFAPYAKMNKILRLRVVDALTKAASTRPSIFYAQTDSYGLSIHHAYSLLFTEPMDTDFYPGRPKVRGKKPPSTEYEVLALAALHSPKTIQLPCSRQFQRIPALLQWTPLHAAIANGNTELAAFLLDSGVSPPKDLVHTAIVSFYPESSFKALLQNLSTRDDYLELVNKAGGNFAATPLQLAAEVSNLAFIQLASSNIMIDMNAPHAETGRTAVHQACLLEDPIPVLDAFLSASDRLDFTVPDCNGVTCLETAVRAGRCDVVIRLMSMRRNDCLNILTQNDSRARQLLYELEREHFALHSSSVINDTSGEAVSDEDALAHEMETLSVQPTRAAFHHIPQEPSVDDAMLMILLELVQSASTEVDFNHFHPLYERKDFDAIVL